MLNNQVRMAPLFVGITLVILGVMVMVGWYWHTPTLMQIAAGVPAIALPTAACFVLAGTALFLQALEPLHASELSQTPELLQAPELLQTPGRLQTWRAVARNARLLLSALIFIIVAFNILHILTGWNFGLAWNASWFDEPAPHQTQMSIPTSLAFLCAATALCLSRESRYSTYGVRVLALAAGALGALALLSYLLRLGSLYNWHYFDYMAPHIAAGMIALAIGLWLLRDDQSWLAQREDGGVIAIAVIVLLVTTISIGVAAWSTEQGHLVTALGDGLRLALRSRSEQIATVIELRSTRAAMIANRPNLLKNLRVLVTDRDNKGSREVVADVLRSFAPFGFSAIAIYGLDQREVARSGGLMGGAELTVPLATIDTTLLWRDDFYLRRRITLRDAAGVLGELIAEQPLPEITATMTRLDEFGRSDELLLCAAQADAIRCFPSAAAPQPFTLPPSSSDHRLVVDALAANSNTVNASAIATLRDFRGHQVVAAYEPIRKLGLIAILKADTAHLYKPLLDQLQRTMLLLFVLITIGTALIYTRVRPLVRALRISQQRLQSALQVSDSHVWDFDFRTDSILVSDGLRAQLGFAGPPQPIALAKWRGWVHPDDLAPDGAAQATRSLLLQERGVEVRLRDSEGEYHWYYFRGGVVETDIHGTPLRALGTATDIGARKQMEQQLIAARIAADDANHAKSLFLSSMSHELRTPLNGVLGYAQILLDSPGTSDEQQRQLSAIESCGHHLLALINDVLDLSKIESGNIEIEHNNCNLYHLLESVSDIVRQRAQSKGLQFILEIDKSVPAFIYIDDIKLRQILVNLLGNAVKFTQQGTVTLRVSTRVVTSAAKELIFQVRDTGIGIPAEKQQEIFQPFRQVGRSAGGTGLGLSISQRLSEAMGGVLLVQSNLGTGSCFSLSLPLVIGEIAKTTSPYNFSHPVLDTGGAAITVMIADDNPINRHVLASIMRANGIDVVEAENGQEVLDKLRQQWVPLVLMDVRMPVMDGLVATRLIKSDPNLHTIKVIVVSASVSSNTIAHTGEVGCDDFIKKPVRVRELLEKVAKHLQLPLREVVQNGRENLSS